MLKNRYQKKPAPPVGDDWHPADVVAALRKAGWSLRRLSMAHGLHPGTLSFALRLPYHNGERVIASHIGVAPQEIWPSRYYADGTPKPLKECTPTSDADNTKAEAAV